jgi:hypothetical protein
MASWKPSQNSCSGSPCMTTGANSLPRAWAQTGRAISRLPYGNLGLEGRLQWPGRLPIPRSAVAFVTSRVSMNLVRSADSTQMAICGPRSRRLPVLRASQGAFTDGR